MSTSQKQESMAEKYKLLFSRTRNLIVSPKSEWSSIHAEKSDLNSILGNYILPYIGVLTLLTFVGYITSHQGYDQGYDFAPALKYALADFTALFGGLYITYFITLNILPKFTVKINASDLKSLSFKICAYSSIVLYLVKMVVTLVPQASYLLALTIYTGYIVWLGTKEIGEFESKDLRVVFTIIVSALLLFIPYFISNLFIRFVGF
ncbi:Yip1 family protein [Labilibacter marinus]|uniref:Yip1 family protein n=1 Tax=Labilibacter marinus TaxID=1477105 RepID=UPI00094F52DE|nr:Yip1 family protein [Labilibacter marinus]